MHSSEFESKREFLLLLIEDAHNASMICIEREHPKHDMSTCPHREVFLKATKKLEKLWGMYLATPIEERYT